MAGAAIHSVRAVPPEHMHPVVAWTARHGAPLHIHMSEQRAENEACRAVYGVSPARLLYDEDVLGPRTTVVHATHVGAADLEVLGGSQVFACLCPTTERDLGDGLAPARPLAAAGCTLTLGSDSHAVIDILEEARGVEYAERLGRRSRGHFTAETLLEAATSAGHTSLGWPDAGQLAPGARATWSRCPSTACGPPAPPATWPWRPRSSPPRPPTSAPSSSTAATWSGTESTCWSPTSPPSSPARSAPP